MLVISNISKVNLGCDTILINDMIIIELVDKEPSDRLRGGDMDVEQT